MDALLLTIEQTAHMLGISRSKTYELVAAGELPTVHIGRCRRVRPHELTQFIERLTGPSAPDALNHSGSR